MSLFQFHNYHAIDTMNKNCVSKGNLSNHTLHAENGFRVLNRGIRMHIGNRDGHGLGKDPTASALVIQPYIVQNMKRKTTPSYFVFLLYVNHIILQGMYKPINGCMVGVDLVKT